MNTPEYPPAPNQRVQWYRTALPKETLASLNAKSDFKGWVQSLGHFGFMVLTASTTLYAAAHKMWWLMALGFFLHGTAASFDINAVHELGHKSVFKTQGLNQFFCRLFAFFGLINHEHFYNSHMRHHQYTLHAPDDLEVVLPLKVLTKHFFQFGFIHIKPWEVVKFHINHHTRLARGAFVGPWEATIFPADQPEKALPTIRWARFLLAGHAFILVLSIALAIFVGWYWLLLPLLTSFPAYGGWLQFLCNNTQHIGLQDNVNDFRLSCRTFTLNPVAQFFYWHMNYHIEHHMFAAVPCYNLAKLHKAILHDLPPCPHGLLATWKEIAAIQRKQVEEPEYQYKAPIPGTAAPQGGAY